MRAGMKRRGGRLCAVFALMLLGMTASATAACPAMFPPVDRIMIPDEDAKVFISYSEKDRLETLVIKPTFAGNAVEFGMVLPVPNRPEINEAPEDLFDALETIAGAIPEFAQFSLDTKSALIESASVTVIERRDVGDFKTTTLGATSADDLVEWLDSNGFGFGDADVENFDYYIQKGGYYFVALEINMDAAAVGRGGSLSGELRPIEFVFYSEQPMLPLRIMANDMGMMKFTMYTLSEIPYYIPGADVHSFGKVSKNFLGSSLDRYDPLGKWVVLTNVELDSTRIKENVLLERAVDLHDAVTANWELPDRDPVDKALARDASRFDPHLLPSDAGILAGAAPTDLLLAEFAELLNPKKQADLGIPAKSIECKDEMSLVTAPGGGRTACIKESSIAAFAEIGWNESTYRAGELVRLR